MKRLDTVAGYFIAFVGVYILATGGETRNALLCFILSRLMLIEVK